MRNLSISLVLLFGLFSPCLAGTIKPNVPDSKYIEYGKKHECVLPIIGTVKDGPNDELKSYVGSCVVIHKRIIITAAHIMGPAETSYVVFKGKKIKVSFALYQKSYDINKMGDNDISICLLEENIDLDYYPELYEDDDEVGKICSISGYGMTGTHSSGVTKSDGNKRAGSNVISGIVNGMLYCSLRDSPSTSLEFLVANGDSGGGLFIDQKLAGINSCIMTDDGNLDSNINDESCHTRISLHKPWIDEQIKKIQAELEKK